LTGEIILDQFIRRKTDLGLSDELYKSRMNKLSSALLLQITLYLFSLLSIDFGISWDFSIYLTSLSSIMILVITRRKIFSNKFTQIYYIVNLLIQMVFISNYANTLSLDFLGTSASIIPPVILLIPVFFTATFYLSIIFTYAIKSGLIFRKVHVSITNLSYLFFYISISLLPSYIYQVISPITVDIQFVFYTIFTSTILLSIIFYLDQKTGNLLFHGPHEWISKAILGKKINLGEGSKANKNSNILLKTLELSELDGDEQIRDPIDLLNSGTQIAELTFRKSKTNRVFLHLSWVNSLVLLISTFLFFNVFVYPINLSISVSLFLGGVFLIFLIKNMINSGILKIDAGNKILEINKVFLLFSTIFSIFNLSFSYFNIAFELTVFISSMISLAVFVFSEIKNCVRI
jgi:hypothetical protein